MRIGRHCIVSKLIVTETISPQSAKTFKDTNITDMFYARVLLMNGIVKEVYDRKYYLDMSRKRQIENMRPLVPLVIFSIILLVYLFIR